MEEMGKVVVKIQTGKSYVIGFFAKYDDLLRYFLGGSLFSVAMVHHIQGP